jgi:hypothetical protein
MSVWDVTAPAKRSAKASRVGDRSGRFRRVTVQCVITQTATFTPSA